MLKGYPVKLIFIPSLIFIIFVGPFYRFESREQYLVSNQLLLTSVLASTRSQISYSMRSLKWTVKSFVDFWFGRLFYVKVYNVDCVSSTTAKSLDLVEKFISNFEKVKTQSWLNPIRQYCFGEVRLGNFFVGE